MNEELLTAVEAATLLKLKLPAFYAFRRRHRIQNSGLGRRLLFAREDLLRARSSQPQVIDFAARGRQLAQQADQECRRA